MLKQGCKNIVEKGEYRVEFNCIYNVEGKCIHPDHAMEVLSEYGERPDDCPLGDKG